MNKKHIKIIAAISVIVVCTASVGYIAYSGVWKDWVAGECESRYAYRIHISSTRDIYNVTLYIPFPMKNGEMSSSLLVDETVNKLSEENWTAEIIDTEHGKMLKISADTPPRGIYIVIHKEVKHVINTKKPVGNEPVLNPRFNDTGNEYKSYIYADYNTSLDNKLDINISMSGVNYRGEFGVSEYYKDQVWCEIDGETHTWYIVNGTLKTKEV